MSSYVINLRGFVTKTEALARKIPPVFLGCFIPVYFCSALVFSIYSIRIQSDDFGGFFKLRWRKESMWTTLDYRSCLVNDFQSVLRSLSTLMFMCLTRWNATRCLSLRATYLIFEAFHILFPIASFTFTAVKWFYQVIWERTKHKASHP